MDISIKRNKIEAIESLRIIASFFVVLLHYFPFEGTIKYIVDETARFAVPFFFVSSGYFLGEKWEQKQAFSVFGKVIKKLCLLYLFWQLIYFLNPIKQDVLQMGVLESYYYKFNLIFEGTKEDVLFGAFGFHLWFLTSLLLSVLIIFVINPKNINYLLVLAIAFYIFGVLAKAYSGTPIGIVLNFNTRNFFFFSLLPVTLGFYIGMYRKKFSITQSLLIIIVGFLGHYLEAYVLRNYFQTDIMDYGFSTFLMGIGVFSFALNEPEILNNKYLVSAGQYSLGIYCIHILIGSRIIEDLNYDFSDWLNCAILPIVVFTLSFGVIYV
jgi:surface polysaccharide O-acyltransferase-like enzyme